MTGRTGLRARVQGAREARFVDLAVPGVDGVFVRYKALPASQLEQTGKRASKLKNGAGLTAALDILAHACVGVFELDSEGVGVSPIEGFDGQVDAETRELTGKLPTFADPELGEELDAEGDTAAATILALYVTDGDVVLTADEVMDHSAKAGEELSREAPAF